MDCTKLVSTQTRYAIISQLLFNENQEDVLSINQSLFIAGTRPIVKHEQWTTERKLWNDIRNSTIHDGFITQNSQTFFQL